MEETPDQQVQRIGSEYAEKCAALGGAMVECGLWTASPLDSAALIIAGLARRGWFLKKGAE